MAASKPKNFNQLQVEFKHEHENHSIYKAPRDFSGENKCVIFSDYKNLSRKRS